MKSTKLKYLIIITLLFISFDATSRIRALNDYMDEEEFNNFDSIDTSFTNGSSECATEYRYTECPETKELKGRCPYNGDYYKSCECKAQFYYTTANCPAPGELSGQNCDNKYEYCLCTAVCPEGYSTTCPSNNEKINNSCNNGYCFKC